MDRRQRKTRTAILDACISLIQEKDFQKITVHEIVKEADINRGTFYLHFEDKYDMMNSFENEMIEKIEKVIVNNLPKESSNQLFLESRYESIVQILKCYEENKELLQFLISSSYSSFQAKLRNKLKLLFSELVFPSLAEYAYQSKTSINIEQSSKLLFNIVLQGPAKTLGLLRDEDSY